MVSHMVSNIFVFLSVLSDLVALKKANLKAKPFFYSQISLTYSKSFLLNLS